MNTNINLCEILKGHEGETFYSPAFGEVKIFEIKELFNKRYIVLSCGQFLDPSGCLSRYGGGECMLFPSKDQRDWNRWIKEQKPKSIPKTWSEFFCENSDIEDEYDDLGCEISRSFSLSDEDKLYDSSGTNNDTPIEKSALALLKIYQLIEAGYGGNVTNEEWESSDIINTISCDSDRTLEITGGEYRNQIAFHTEEQAKEFLSYPENIQLLKDYFMI